MIFFSLLPFFSFSIHPLLLALCLVLAALSLMPTISYFSSSWVAISLTLLFLGGMMVTYLFIISLSNHEKLMIPNKIFAWTGAIITITITLMIFLEIHYFEFEDLKLNFVYSFSNSSIILMLTMVLLITLFTVMKLAKCFKGALSQTK